MPEGPSIIIAKEAMQQFKGDKIIKVSGNSKLDIERLAGEKIIDFKSWGKHFLICFKKFTLRIHFMLFGSYSINEKKSKQTRLALHFKTGNIYFYACTLQFIDENIDDVYDWSADVMSDYWNAPKARKKLKQQPNTLICDALLDQHIFAGAGNIIKNEVCYRVHIHPESKVGGVPVKRLNELIKETRNYSFDFLEWKKNFVLSKHWEAYSKKICKRCNLPIIKKYSGKTKRRTFFCTNCQVFYDFDE